jgi:hypothetical protein
MKTNHQNSAHKNSIKIQPNSHFNPRPRWGWILSIGGVMIGCVAWTLWVPNPSDKFSSVEATTHETEPKSEALAAEAAASPPNTTVVAASPAEDSKDTPHTPLSGGELDALSTQIQNWIAMIRHTDGVAISEKATQWQAGLQSLIAGGSASVPAIQRFLQSHQDTDFDSELKSLLGYSNARSGFIEALRKIGGTEAISAMATTLETAMSPREVALLTHHLEESAPGQYRDIAVKAARDQLARAESVETSDADVGPLFEVMGHYGNAATAQELEAATGRWKYYALSAMAQMPDGAGLPSLLKLAEDTGSGGARLQALQVLTEMAPNQPAAREFLVGQLGNGNIPADYWNYLKTALVGNQYFPTEAVITEYPNVPDWSEIQTVHIHVGNQNLYSIPSNASQTQEGIQTHLAFVNQLLGFATDESIKSNLQQAQEILQNRFEKNLISQQESATENP